jgi:hypothetical protein
MMASRLESLAGTRLLKKVDEALLPRIWVLGAINAGLDPFLFLLRWHTGQHWGFCSVRFDGGDSYQSGIHTAGTSVHRPLGLVFEQKINDAT